MELEYYGSSIEGASCAYDVEGEGALNDNDAIRIIELLIDKYHFQDEKLDREDQISFRGFQYVDKCVIHQYVGQRVGSGIRVLRQ